MKTMNPRYILKTHGPKLFILFALLLFIAVANISAGYKEHEAKAVFLPNSDYLHEVVKSIEKAKKNIVISMYMFKTTDYTKQASKHIQDALYRAAEKGVEVTVLFDIEKEKGFLNDVNKETAAELREKGINVIYDPVDVRTHTKLVVIDEEIVFIGSHNFTHSAMVYNNEASAKIISEDFARKTLEYIEGIH
jgi:phosphatidylserine/phosphatidylglycerophosphate/cardiolipin synthase-like enzyme